MFSVESSASRVALFSVSRKRLYDRECSVTTFRQGRYTPLAPFVRLSFADGKFEKPNTKNQTVDWSQSAKSWTVFFIPKIKKGGQAEWKK